MQKVLAKNTSAKAAKRYVIQALREVLSDPDAGLALTVSFEKRLRASIRSGARGNTRDLRSFLKRT
jgi:hypothetical protein